MTRLAIAFLALASCQLALAETIVLKQRVSIPMFIGGKKVGSTGAPIGSQLEVLAREGTKMQVKFRNLEPVWIESSALGIEKDTPSTQVPSAPAISTFDPLKAIKALEAPGTNAITSLLQGRTYPDPASQEEFSSSLAKFVDAKARIAKGQRALPSVQQEVKRLRRNADVAGQPSTLNPGDTSGQERAQKIREEADTMEAEAEGEIENAQEQLDEAKSSLTQLLEGWQTAEANIREEQARLAEEKKEEESKSAQDKADDSSHQIEAGSSPSTNTIEQSEDQPDSRPNKPYAGLNEKAIWSINFWDKDGDNLLAWTENLMRQSGLSSEEASQLVIDEVDLDSTLYTPEKIAAKGGRAKLYQDGIEELLQEELDRRKGRQKFIATSKATESAVEKSDSTAQQSQETAPVPVPRYEYQEKYNEDTPADELIKASDANDAEAQYMLGQRHLRKNSGVPFDEAKGVGLVTKAAEAGYAPAQYELGCWFHWNHYDLGPPHGNDELGSHWWKKASDQGYPEALYWMAECYYDEVLSYPKDVEKAVALYSSAANQGHNESRTKLAYIYQKGGAIKQDLPRAFNLYLQAAEQGDETGQRGVANCYNKGLGVSRDPEQAAKWLAKAEETKAKRAARLTK